VLSAELGRQLHEGAGAKPGHALAPVFQHSVPQELGERGSALLEEEAHVAHKGVSLAGPLPPKK